MDATIRGREGKDIGKSKTSAGSDVHSGTVEVIVPTSRLLSLVARALRNARSVAQAVRCLCHSGRKLIGAG